MRNSILISFLWVVVPIANAMDSVKYAKLRDENVLGTIVTSRVARNTVGHYVYTYDVESPSSNTGKIQSFVVDVSCDSKVEQQEFNPADYPSRAHNFYSEDGKHVPVAVGAARGQAATYGLGAANHVDWMIAAKPGESRTGLTLISPYPPGPRVYQIVPSVRYNEEQWDYSDVEEEDPEVPWLPDWTVTGITTGPACPGEEYPEGEEDGSARFPGTPGAVESEELNELLTYSAPLVDQLYVDGAARELEMTIHYHERIDPKTFRVTPEKGQLRRLFNPRPGTSETVRLPLQPGKNRIELQVQAGFVPPGKADKPVRESRGRGGASMDRDVFVVRVPQITGSTPAKGKK